MNKPFADPDFLQAVGEMTISFALLDGTLTAVLNTIDGDTELSDLAAMGYSEKVDWFIELAKFEFARLKSIRFAACDFDRLKNDLTGVAALRNSLNHDFWTMGPNERISVKSLKKKGVPERYPTSQKIRKLAARTWAVRSQLADVVNEHAALRRAESHARNVVRA